MVVSGSTPWRPWPARATATSDFTAGKPEQISGYVDEVLTSLYGVEVALDQELVAEAEADKSAAERAATLFVILALVAVLAVAAAAVLLGRRITRPLQALTTAAERLSKEQMPKLVESLRNPADEDLAQQLGGLQAIDVGSNDEIGQLADAFNDVQKVAGEVAAEQAALLRKGIGEMFVNLARRNQALLDRQIDFIDELERAEEDPDQLENLYRLDHLATRMRRNAESLLVLAGAEPPRRRGRPAPLANVVRAALAEVEDFARIDLLSLDEVLVASNAAADIAHLLSELMENATNFSPPETKVEVVGHRTKADGYVVSVSDHGIGMSAEQMSEANQLLAKPPVVGLALSRSLGFIVVGRLARRHGITVKTMASASGGVTAIVTLPPTLITDGLSGGTAPAPVPVGRPVRPRRRRRRSERGSDTRPAAADAGPAPLTFEPLGAAPSTNGSSPLSSSNGSANGSSNGSGRSAPAPDRDPGRGDVDGPAEPAAAPRSTVVRPVGPDPTADGVPEPERQRREGPAHPSPDGLARTVAVQRRRARRIGRRRGATRQEAAAAPVGVRRARRREPAAARRPPPAEATPRSADQTPAARSDGPPPAAPSLPNRSARPACAASPTRDRGSRWVPHRVRTTSAVRTGPGARGPDRTRADGPARRDPGGRASGRRRRHPPVRCGRRRRPSRRVAPTARRATVPRPRLRRPPHDQRIDPPDPPSRRSGPGDSRRRHRTWCRGLPAVARRGP